MNLEPKQEEGPKYKRNLMGEFIVLYEEFNPINFSSIEQINDETIHMSLEQYPDQGKTYDITISEPLRRLRFFGWEIKFIKYNKDSTLHIYFEKVDWRSREAYGLMPTKHNNEKELWWLDPDAKPEVLGI